MKKFYITTAIDYMNGKPHIGHAYEKIATDVINRHYKQRGLETYFLTGSDEHGIKIEKTAKDQGKTPKQLCDDNSEEFKKSWKQIGVDYDRYIRTTDLDHREVVQHIFKTLLEKGDIYKAAYTGLYCSGCESFLSPKDLTEDGLCPHHLTKPQEVQEENYFFKLSKYKQAIIDRIKSDKMFVMPEYRVNEILNQLEDIEDISVSRSVDSVTWGIPVPGDDSQIIYVWIDALSNYLTGVGYLKNEEMFKKYWPADVHLIGKDILKFHSIYWIAILMAMDIELPKSIHAHGWITIEETKMSKSLGNVLPPDFIMQEFELEKPDAARYFLMAAATYGKDINYSSDDFKNKVNADLANNLGNLLNRTLSMLVKYFDGAISPESVTDNDCELAKLCDEAQERVLACFNEYKIAAGIEAAMSLVDAANKYVNDTAPWSLAKDEATLPECAKVLYNVLETMRFVSIMLYPVIPNISQNIWQQLSLDGNVANQKWDSLAWNGLKSGKIASKETVSPVFLRLDSEIAGDKKKK